LEYVLQNIATVSAVGQRYVNKSRVAMDGKTWIQASDGRTSGKMTTSKIEKGMEKYYHLL
jgi:hypothetical protein